MSDTTPDAPQVWRVSCHEGGVRSVTVVRTDADGEDRYTATRSTRQWGRAVEASANGSTARLAITKLAARLEWEVIEILAPGQPSRAEVERERDTAWAARDEARLETAEVRAAGLGLLKDAVDAQDELRCERDALRAVVAALETCATCEAPATTRDPAHHWPLYCDDHARPADEGAREDLPYAAEVRALKGTR